MGIKRGVSFYSYQQEQFFRKMDWKAMVRELHDNLKTDGVEIIDESTIPHYPFPSDEFIYDWNSYLARYDMKAVTKDIYFDPHQFRDHVMNHKEAAERLKYDIILAAKMGFANVRCLAGIPIDVIEIALPTAEKYNVKIGKEIHAPWPIKLHGEPEHTIYGIMDSSLTDEICALADKYHTKYVGLVPDFGIFQFQASQVSIDYCKRNSPCPECVDFVLENRFNYSKKDLTKLVEERYPNNCLGGSLGSLMLTKSVAEPEDLREFVPYIVSIHGKFYQMTEIEGQPGHYEDKCINYIDPIRILNEEGFEGYIDSEYEGQRDQQDRGDAFLPDGVQEVRRHHEMLQRLFDETALNRPRI